MIILGIDPGLASTGFGLIRCDGPSPVLLRCGSIRTPAHDAIPDRLMQIHEDMDKIIDQARPDLVVLENVFSLVRYPRAGILLGSVIGALYLTVRQRGLPVHEISPKEVKNALVGFGNAGKKQIKSAVQSMLKTGELPSFHAADALAVALTAYYRKDQRRAV